MIPPRVIVESRCKIVFFVSAKINLKEHHRSNLPSSVIELYAKTRWHPMGRWLKWPSVSIWCIFWGVKMREVSQKTGAASGTTTSHVSVYMGPTTKPTGVSWTFYFYQGEPSNFGKWIVSHMYTYIHIEEACWDQINVISFLLTPCWLIKRFFKKYWSNVVFLGTKTPLAKWKHSHIRTAWVGTKLNTHANFIPSFGAPTYGSYFLATILGS